MGRDVATLFVALSLGIVLATAGYVRCTDPLPREGVAW